MVKKARVKRPRYKNDVFLKALGTHCRQIRVQKGYSIDRLAKESDQLSPATIDRLERGLADSQILVLVRYAEALGINLMELFSFVKDMPDLSKDSRIIPYEPEVRAPQGYVAVYPIKVAAGLFSDDRLNDEVPPMGWVDARVKSNSDHYFAAFVNGESMQPLIQNGDLCLFKKHTGGTKQGKILLVQANGVQNSETGESFVVKRYVRQSPRPDTENVATTIHLISENPRFSPIILVGMSDDNISVIAEFVRVL